MGIYVNPPGTNNEAFLRKHGEKLASAPALINGDDRLVVLVDNGWMKAAAVIFDDRELRDFTLPDDKRPKEFFRVPLESLRSAVAPGDFSRLVA